MNGKKIIYLLLSIFLMHSSLWGKNIRIVPFAPSYCTVFFQENYQSSCCQGFFEGLLRAKKLFSLHGHSLDTILIPNIIPIGDKLIDKLSQEEIDALIFFNFPPSISCTRIKNFNQKKLILFLWEPPTIFPQQYKKSLHALFKKIYTFQETLIDNKKYFFFCYPEKKSMITTKPTFTEKKLCNMIVANKTSTYKYQNYSYRKKVINFFETFYPQDFDLYGHGWSNTRLTVYKGVVKNKIDIMKNYKFSICFENTTNIDGYITEKIFDCFTAGTVPIYSGCPNIEKYIPSNCFIDMRNFSTIQDLYNYINSMSYREYQEILDNIQKFLQSKQGWIFTPECFAQTLLKSIEE